MDVTERVINTVLKNQGLTRDRLFSKTREADVITVRHIICYILHVHMGFSLSTIGRMLARKEKALHHTTILHSCRRVKDLLEVRDEQYTSLYYKSMEDLEKDEHVSKYENRKLIVFYPEDVNVHDIIKLLNENFISLNYTMF